jgi:hypothetical protein
MAMQLGQRVVLEGDAGPSIGESSKRANSYDHLSSVARIYSIQTLSTSILYTP